MGSLILEEVFCTADTGENEDIDIVESSVQLTKKDVNFFIDFFILHFSSIVVERQIVIVKI